jgi:hypothetical protein
MARVELRTNFTAFRLKQILLPRSAAPEAAFARPISWVCSRGSRFSSIVLGGGKRRIIRIHVFEGDSIRDHSVLRIESIGDEMPSGGQRFAAIAPAVDHVRMNTGSSRWCAMGARTLVICHGDKRPATVDR